MGTRAEEPANLSERLRAFHGETISDIVVTSTLPSAAPTGLWVTFTNGDRLALEIEQPANEAGILGFDFSPEHDPRPRGFLEPQPPDPRMGLGSDSFRDELEAILLRFAAGHCERTLPARVKHQAIEEILQAIRNRDFLPPHPTDNAETDERRIRRIVRDELLRVRAAEIRRKAEQAEEEFRAAVARQNVAAEFEAGR